MCNANQAHRDDSNLHVANSLLVVPSSRKQPQTGKQMSTEGQSVEVRMHLPLNRRGQHNHEHRRCRDDEDDVNASAHDREAPSMKGNTRNPGYVVGLTRIRSTSHLQPLVERILRDTHSNIYDMRLEQNTGG